MKSNIITTSTGKTVKTLDNKLNKWVRDIKTGKFVRNSN